MARSNQVKSIPFNLLLVKPAHMSQRLRVEWKRTTLDMPRCDRTAATDTTKAYGNSSKITSRFLCTFKLHSIYDYSLSCSTTPVLLWDNYVQVVPVISVTTSSVDAVYHATRRQHSFDDTATFLWPPYVIGGHYVFALWFLSIFYLSFFFYSSPNLSGLRLDVYHTSTHGVQI